MGETHSEGKGLGINACSYSATKRNRPNFAEVDVSEEAARVLFLTYRHDAIEMAALRCVELRKEGDKEGVASWRKILSHVRKLAAANQDHGTIN
jgi:hypothetical protein